MQKESVVYLTAASIHQYQNRWYDDAVEDPAPDGEWVSLVERLIKEWRRGEPWHPAFLTGNLAASMDGVERAFNAMRQTGFARFSVAIGVELMATLSEILSWPEAHKTPHMTPSIKAMDRQGVPHEQIARIYGMVEPLTGRGIIGHVEQELIEPGSILGSDWIHPQEKARLERREVIEQWLRNCPEAGNPKAIAEKLQSMEVSPSEPMEHNPVASIEEAFVRGMTEHEASQLLDLPLVQVMARYGELQEGADPVIEPIPDEEDDLPSRQDLLRELRDLGIVMHHNVGRKKLAERIVKAKQERIEKVSNE